MEVAAARPPVPSPTRRRRLPLPGPPGPGSSGRPPGSPGGPPGWSRGRGTPCSKNPPSQLAKLPELAQAPEVQGEADLVLAAARVDVEIGVLGGEAQAVGVVVDPEVEVVQVPRLEVVGD